MVLQASLKLSRGPWGGGGFDSFQAPIRRSSKMQKFTSKRRRANLKHAKSWKNMHRPVADRAGFVISRMFTVFCLHRPRSIASQRQYSGIP